MAASVKTLIVIIAALAVVFLSGQASSQDKDKKSYWQLKQERSMRIYKTRPRRLDEPLRETNISDEEVREIEAVTGEIFPGSIVNIAGVTAGCPCEDGAMCDSQVWVVAYQDGRNDGLLLSRIDNQWTIGPVQRWWHQYQSIRAHMALVLATKSPDRGEQYRALLQQQSQLQEQFPLCAIDEQPVWQNPDKLTHVTR